MKKLLYLLSLAYPISSIIGIFLVEKIGVVGFFFAPIMLFFVFPIAEVLFGNNRSDVHPESIKTYLDGSPFWIVCLLVFAHFAIIIWGLMLIAKLPFIAYLGLTVSVGITTGALGITTAHELIHKQHAGQRAIGLAMLLAVMNMFFYTEHLKGHHKNVATDDDPTSARFGENFYQFLWRSSIGIFNFLVEHERKNLARHQQRFLRWNNPSLWFLLAPLFLLLVIVITFGWVAIPYFVGQSMVAYFLLEVVSYIEHYGLRRQRAPDGSRETTKDEHTWDADFVWSNYATLNLQHHAHHHAAPTLGFHLLEARQSAHQLPFGYPTMAVIACIPFLWHRLMDDRLNRCAQDACAITE